MKNLALTIIALATMTAFVACDRTSQDTDGPGHKADTDAAEHADHAAGEADHDDANHAHEREEPAGHGHAGEEHALGTRKIGDYTVVVARLGDLRPKMTEIVLEISVQGSGTPTAIRVQIKTPAGEESLKVKANRVGEGQYDAHVGELPPNLPPGSQVWVEVAEETGTAAAAFELFAARD